MTMTQPDKRADDAGSVALRESGYRAIFDGAGDAILVTDAEARYIDANTAACTLLGYSRDELRGMRVHDIAERTPAWVDERFRGFVESGSFRDDLEIRRKDGTVLPVEANATRIELPDGPVFIAVLRDLSERRRVEETQRVRAERLRTLTDALPVFISFVDAGRRYTFANQAYEEWLGRPRSEVVGRRVSEVLGEAGYATVRPYIDRALAGEQVSFETVVPFADGRVRTISAVYLPHREDGRLLGFFAMVSDVTDRRRAEDALRVLADTSATLVDSLEYEATLSRLAELAVPRLADACVVDMLDESGGLRRVAVASVDLPKAAWVWDVAREPLDPNAAHGPAAVLRTGESEFAPDVTEELLRAAARSPEHLAQLRRTRIVSHMIVPLRARGRTLGTLTFITSKSRRRYDAGDLALAEQLADRAALAVDNARLYREAQEALRGRDDVLGSVSHDLRTPLTSIKGRAQLLLRRFQRLRTVTPETVIEAMTAIDQTTDRMNALLEELVDIGRLDDGRSLELRREMMDIVALARLAIDEAQRTTGRHQLRLDSTETAIEGEWDASRLERVLANLLSNAVRYSPGGGEVLIVVRREGGHARLAVQDTGVGIPTADLPHIFDRFHRGSNVSGRIPGTGIGLAGARQIVEQHGGTIAIDSVEGSGTTVTVRLPLRRDEGEG